MRQTDYQRGKVGGRISWGGNLRSWSSGWRGERMELKECHSHSGMWKGKETSYCRQRIAFSFLGSGWEIGNTRNGLSPKILTVLNYLIVSPPTKKCQISDELFLIYVLSFKNYNCLDSDLLLIWIQKIKLVSLTDKEYLTQRIIGSCTSDDL